MLKPQWQWQGEHGGERACQPYSSHAHAPVTRTSLSAWGPAITLPAAKLTPPCTCCAAAGRPCCCSSCCCHGCGHWGCCCCCAIRPGIPPSRESGRKGLGLVGPAMRCGLPAPAGLTPLCAPPAQGGCSGCCTFTGTNPLLTPHAPPPPPPCMCAASPRAAGMLPLCNGTPGRACIGIPKGACCCVGVCAPGGCSRCGGSKDVRWYGTVGCSCCWLCGSAAVAASKPGKVSRPDVALVRCGNAGCC